MKKLIIISAVNLVEGGPLTILQDCLQYLSASLADEYRIIALINKKGLFVFENIEYLEFPKSKKSWGNRLYYEYFYFYKLAKRLKPFLWLSLHDITPNVTANRLAVYCHNASPFYRLPFKEAMLDPKFALFNIFYRYLYAINIKKADFVIVQQEWLRQSFIKLYKLSNVIVAHPNALQAHSLNNLNSPDGKKENFVFLYPSFPRVFKNFEVISKAVEILLKQGIGNFEVIFTVSGAENRYAQSIYRGCKHFKNIKFIGIQGKESMSKLYDLADCIIFPSKLETWGFPITEAKIFSKPLLLADLGYAHETLGEYDKAIFFGPLDHEKLAEAMGALINKTAVFEKTKKSIIPDLFAENWKELFEIMLSSKPARTVVSV